MPLLYYPVFTTAQWSQLSTSIGITISATLPYDGRRLKDQLFVVGVMVMPLIMKVRLSSPSRWWSMD